jgi:hypothetical protein
MFIANQSYAEPSTEWQFIVNDNQYKKIRVTSEFDCSGTNTRANDRGGLIMTWPSLSSDFEAYPIWKPDKTLLPGTIS